MTSSRKIRIAFFDIDGTLVSFKTHRIPDSALNTIKNLAKHHIEIVIVTGRGAEPIPEISDIPYDSIIGLNGTECVMKDGTLLYRHSIPEDMFEEVLKIANELDFAVAAKFSEGFVVDRITPRVEEMAARIASPCPPIRNIREMYRMEGTGQMCIFTDEETERKIMNRLPGLSSSRWCDTFADINIRGIDKGTGVCDYLDFRGLCKEEAISFGDGGNDIPMLKNTGIAIAMGNACESLKKIASYITDDIDNDGIAKAIQHLRII